MSFPLFYKQAPVIKMRDPLADFLGAAQSGVIEYCYEDAVKTAGHSCPTVASAFLMAVKGLAALYPNELPERGAIRVELQQDKTAGVCGVIANVLSLITGATEDTGFKGIAGRFDRRNLLAFNAPISAELRLQRVDTGVAVCLSSQLESIPAQPRMRELLGSCLNGQAGAAQQQEFGALWQERVRRILVEHADDPAMIRIEIER